jgi:hypothetical protein
MHFDAAVISPVTGLAQTGGIYAEFPYVFMAFLRILLPDQLALANTPHKSLT